MIKWKGIVLHHSASPQGFWKQDKWVAITVADIRNWHVHERGWSDVGYHYIVLNDGKIQKGRPLNRYGAHTRASRRNFTSIGVCLVGNFQYDTVSPLQLKAAVSLVHKLQEDWGIPLQKIEMHKQVPGSNSLCPGRFFPWESFLNLLKKT